MGGLGLSGSLSWRRISVLITFAVFVAALSVPSAGAAPRTQPKPPQSSDIASEEPAQEAECKGLTRRTKPGNASLRSCPNLPKKVVPWSLRPGKPLLGSGGGSDPVPLVVNEAGDELEVSFALPSTPFKPPFKKDCALVIPYIYAAYNPCGYVTFYDANWETSEKAPDTNEEEDAEYDACGKLVSSGKTAGWHVVGTEYTLTGWHAGHEEAIPSSEPTPCLGIWTLVYSWTQTFSDSETLKESAEVPFLVTAVPVAANTTWGGGNPSQLRCAQDCYGDPVNTATGDYYETTTDLAIPGRGPGLQMTRTYSSLAARAGQTSALGDGWSFSYDMSLSVDEETGDAIVTNPNGSQTKFEAESEEFSAAPQILATLVENEDGSFTYTVRDRTIYDFDSAGKLISIADLNGNETALSYDESGRLESAEDEAERSLTFAYDESGRLESVSDSTERSVSYGYDEAGHLEDVTDVRGGHTEYGYEGNLLTTRKDARGNLVLTNTYDAGGRVLTQTDGLENTSTFSYAGTYPFTSTAITNPRGYVTEYEYEYGQLVKRVEAAKSGSKKATWIYEHDPETGGITKVSDPPGRATYATYDSKGNQTSTKDGLGHETKSVYDSLNDLIEYTDAEKVTTTYEYDESGNLLGSSTPLVGSEPAKSREVAYLHEDEAHPGDVTAIVDPNGKTTNFAYDSAGNLTSLVDQVEGEATYTYDERGNRLTEVSPRGNVEGAEPAKYTTTYTYDADGNRLTSTDPLGHERKWSYDANGNVEEETDANSHATTYSYNASDQAIEVERPDGQVEKTTYDGDGNVESQIDGLENATTYAYDPLDHLKSSTDPLKRTTTYEFDGAGNLKRVTDPQSRLTVYAYNAATELIETSYSDESTPTVEYEYDANGRRTAMTDGTGESTYEYDSLGRLTETTDGHADTTAYGYDLAGNLTSIEYPNGKTVSRAFDDAGRLKSVEDWLGNTTGFAYDPDSNLEATTFPEGTENLDEYAYDRADRLEAISVKQGSEALASLSYARDAVGQIEELSSEGLPGAESEAFEYDENDRLAKAGSESFEYDAANNLIKAPGTTNAYDAASQLETGTGVEYRYDELGQRIEGGPPTAAYLSSFGSKGSENGEFEHPAGIEVDGEGDLWVVDEENDRVQKFSPAGEYLGSFGSTGSEAGELDRPTDIAIDAKGNLWVTDAGNNRVEEFSEAGEYLSQFGSEGSGNGEFAEPTSLDIDVEGDIWVADTYNGRLQEFDGEGEFIRVVGEYGEEEGQLLEPVGLSVCIGNSIWVADWGNNRVTEFDQEGEFVRQIGTYGSGIGEFEQPAAVDLDPKGNVWVGDEGNGRVQAFDASGEYLGQFGSSGSGAGEFGFEYPMGIATDSKGHIWISDAGGNRVQKWELSELGHPTTYDYDQAGNLTAVQRTSSMEVPTIDETYSYDGTGLRASQAVSETTSYLTWDRSGELPLLLSDGQTSYIYGPGGLPIEQISEGEPTYYHHDQLGSTRVLTDASGDSVGTFTYEAYGGLAKSTGSVTTPLGYAGQYTNAESGLQYLRARVYDPTTGQFLTRDTLAVGMSSPYNYGNSNPLRFVDPSGACGLGSVGDALESVNPFSPENCAYQAADSLINLLGGNADAISQVTGVLSAALFATGVGTPVAAALAGLSAATGAYAAGQSAANGEAVMAALSGLGAVLGSEALAFKLFSSIAKNGIKNVRWLEELGEKLRAAVSADEVAKILDQFGYGVLADSILCSAVGGL